MVTLGYFLSSEDSAPSALVEQAKRAEQAGLEALWISDHFHPWIKEQGHSPFVWAVLGAIGQVTRLPVTTAVTCPTMRLHPAIVAHAAATTACLLEGRFALGVGTGENLNEHVLGDKWPTPEVRLSMLEEAVEVMRKLWNGGVVDHDGEHYLVENAQLFDLPERPPPVLVSAFGPKAVQTAARIGDGYICTMPSKDLVEAYRASGGTGKVQGGMKACYAADETTAIDTVHRYWPNLGVPGQLSQDLPTPSHFEQVSALVPKEAAAQGAVVGPDPQRYVDRISEYADAGFDEVYLNQIGPDQEAFFSFVEREIRPAVPQVR